MSFAFPIILIITSMILGMLLAKMFPYHLKCWSAADIIWVGCWAAAAFLAVHEYDKAVEKAHHDYVIQNLKYLQESVHFLSSGLKKNMCSNTAKPKASNEYCGALENIILLSNSTLFNDIAANRVRKEIENLALTSKLPDYTMALTFNLQQFSDYYLRNKDAILKLVSNPEADPFNKKTMVALMCIPFALRFGRSWAELYRLIWPRPQGPHRNQTHLNQ